MNDNSNRGNTIQPNQVQVRPQGESNDPSLNGTPFRSP